ITYLHRRLKSWFTLGEYSPTLFTYPKHEFHIRLMGLVNQTGFGQVPLPFGRLLRTNVTFKSMLPFDFTRSSKSESFFGTGIGLTLGITVILLFNYFRSNDKEHSLPFQLGHLLHFSMFLQGLCETKEEDFTLLLVNDGTSSEMNIGAHFRTFF